MDEPTVITCKQRKAEDVLVSCLGIGMTISAAGRAAKVDRNYVRKLLKDPAFVGRVNEFRAQALDAARGQLTALWKKATARLECLLDSETESVALGAIRELRSSVAVMPPAAEEPARAGAQGPEADLLAQILARLKATRPPGDGA